MSPSRPATPLHAERVAGRKDEALLPAPETQEHGLAPAENVRRKGDVVRACRPVPEMENSRLGRASPESGEAAEASARADLLDGARGRREEEVERRVVAAGDAQGTAPGQERARAGPSGATAAPRRGRVTRTRARASSRNAVPTVAGAAS